jgi:hypothetical protein
VHTIRDFGVIFERVPLIGDNTSAISVAKIPVFHKRMRHLETRHHFLRDHVKKGDIEMRYIDTERQLADIFIKPLMLFALLLYREKLVFAILMAWFEGEFVFYLVYLYHFAFLLHFLHIKLSSPCFTCYTSLYLVDYAYHCARVSRNEL